MDSRIGMHLEAEAAEAFSEMEKFRQKIIAIEDKYREMGTSSKKVTKEQRDMAREAKKAFDDIRGPQERYNARMTALKTLVSQNKISMKEYGDAAHQAQQRLEGAGRAGQQAFGPQALGQLKSMATGFLGISALVGSVGQGFRVWIENMREMGQESRKAMEDVLGFAALQEPGERGKNTIAAMNMAAAAGITDRKMAMDTIQAMQSAPGGTFAKGISVAEEIFSAKHAGMQLEDAREVATMALGLGFDAGTALRQAHVAGEVSQRSPRELAKAGAGLKYWQDREVGWAAAATLSAQLPAEQLGVYLKRGGMGLSTAPGAVQKKFESMGLGKAGQLERLEALAKAGVTTPEMALRFGFTEIREAEAVAGLVKQFPSMKATAKAIHERATPGLFQRERGGIEAEVPGARFARDTDILNAQLANELVIGPGAEKARQRERRNKAMALALRKSGREQFAFMDLITAGENPTLTGWGQVLWEPDESTETARMAGVFPVVKEYQRIMAGLNAAAANLNRAAENLKATSRQRPVQQSN